MCHALVLAARSRPYASGSATTCLHQERRHPRRDALKKFLEDNGVGCAVHYPIPLHLQKAYAHLGYKSGNFPVAEMAAHECLSLPIYPELTDTQIIRVEYVIKKFPF